MAEEAVNLTDTEEEQEIPERLPVLPLHQGVLFPELTVPLLVSRPDHIKLIDEALVKDRALVAVAQRDNTVEKPGLVDLYRVGVAAFIMKMMRSPEGHYHLLVRTSKKVRLTETVQEEPYLVATVEVIEEAVQMDKQIEAMVLNIRNLFQKVVELANMPAELGIVAANVEGPHPLISLVASNLDLTLAEAQEILETLEIQTVLERLTVNLNQRLETLELSQEIQKKIKDGMDKTQRDYMLREQLKAIQRELGEGDERTVEIDELKKKLEETPMPDEVRDVAGKELDRLSKMPPAAAEYTVSRTYLDWLLELPWKVSTDDNLDIAAAQETLDADHYDLEKVKKRVIEYLAVRKLKQDMKGPILCFVGPPGVGKTSLGQSIARTLGREFIRISLGGVRDEAEIRGHRRTYVGALPGRIVQGLRKAGANNPVFMLDEIDKVGTDFRGDPSSALLEVLDPEQNHTFSDHYLEVPIDLSQVMFITTANILDTIPPALRDRMEVIELPGYIEEDKLMIAKRYLLPEQLEAHGLKADLIELEDDAIRSIIRSYTREAGVRNLERQIAAVCRGVAKEVVAGREQVTRIGPDNLEEFLGPVMFIPELAARAWGPGLATGLAWTPTGGDIIFIEAARMSGKGSLTLTGQLGDVMKESATAALTYVRAHATELNIDKNFLDGSDIHIHVPAGAIPKDGPSAGIAMLVTLASLISGKPVRRDVAMTGEITLRGDVLPVGGIKEKVLAAHRAGIREVILPHINDKDLPDVPEQVRETMQFHLVRTMPDALEVALEQTE
ncbi:MAG: endopeptidase La [Deltaproteobacteria bacterium]|jgi:ATP-dependent Lon protease|nr:endopeptidase La [Deltaproteobacteria bacterium]